jgi:hypothetical protein
MKKKIEKKLRDDRQPKNRVRRGLRANKKAVKRAFNRCKNIHFSSVMNNEYNRKSASNTKQTR